ncbi:MAG: CBS domain-containing protein [Deltaproteobacteria bacterium]|nr:CBS domain-containing protein [Deltaproteobacteria bacterium]
MNIEKLSVQELMQTDIKVVNKSTNLSEAGRMMRDSGVSSLVVEPDGDGDAFGIITRKDIVEAFLSRTVKAPAHLVEDAMTQPAITVNLGMSIYNCQQLMRMVGVRRLPVVDGTKLVGILSNADIFGRLLEDIV